jgi:hypothetical protein
MPLYRQYKSQHWFFCSIFRKTNRMKRVVRNIFYAFPIQLLILHFRKYQVLLLAWLVLISTINSGLMRSFGADALFLAPDYLGKVNAWGAAIVGVAMGVFIMSWNITTFILHSKRCKFLATTAKPFLKYCINNAILPLLFIGFYCIRIVQFDQSKELMGNGEIVLLLTGLIGGFSFSIAFSLIYFFGAEKTIQYRMSHIISDPNTFRQNFDPRINRQEQGFGMTVSYYFSTGFRLRKARNVEHYNKEYLDAIFKRHHLAAIISVILAFVFLAMVGFFLDNKWFEVPAAASIFIFFAVATAVIGALTYFLQSWSVLFVILLLYIVNLLYRHEVIDPRNKAYGIHYTTRALRPAYNKESLQRLCRPDMILRDKAIMEDVLNHWKRRQDSSKPMMVIINVSGGGLRSAAFTMHTLQQLDSMTGGRLMRQTFLISGASGGMLAAAYYRELYRQHQKGNGIASLHDPVYTNRITGDLLNPVFSSMIARDIFAPAQRFSVGPYRYVKDRGFAFERKLNENTGGILDIQLKDLADDERQARIPLIFFNSVVTRDGRKMLLSTLPVSYMMKPAQYLSDSTTSPDAVDFAALFARQDPMNIRLLTALRMNATFPYVLPNVWLPSEPVIDVMDAGLRDNFGQETALRFMDHFADWIRLNTKGVLLVQLRDRLNDNWQHPLETGSVTDILLKPATMLQNNWYKLQDFFQTDQYAYLHDDTSRHVNRLTFMYLPAQEDKGAALNFHLTGRERKDVIASFNHPINQATAAKMMSLLR